MGVAGFLGHCIPVMCISMGEEASKKIFFRTYSYNFTENPPAEQVRNDILLTFIIFSNII
jgi:hypothetical protein